MKFTDEVQWLEVLLVCILVPIFSYLFAYVYKLYKYRGILGEYVGGTSTVTIRFPFFQFGYLVIDAVEGSGVRWMGKYKMDDFDTTMTGIYRWNINKKTAKPDVGKHILIFSEDRSTINGTWENLFNTRSGTFTWNKQ